MDASYLWLASNILSMGAVGVVAYDDYRVRKTLERYTNLDVAINAPDVKLEKDIKTKTISFLDMKGFTTMASKYRADYIANILNTFSQTVSENLDKSGTFANFIGDGIVLSYDDAKIAVENTIHILNVLDIAFKSVDLSIKITAGIHTGDIFTGTVGNFKRMDYAYIGDAANTASRMQSLCGYYEERMLISGDTINAAGQEVEALFFQVDTVRVKGREAALKVFAEPSPGGICAAYSSALSCYRTRRFDDAKSIFVNLTKIAGEKSGVFERWAARCEVEKSISPKDWDGIFTHSSK